jgi:hypothetical protein
MSQTINLSDRIAKDRGLQDMTCFVLIHALSEYDKAHKKDLRDIAPDSTKIEVEFKINGHDMDFVELMGRLAEGRDAYILEKAEELVKEKFAATIERIDNASKDAIDKFRKDLGLPEKERWDE